MKSISTHQYFLEDIFAEGWRVACAIFAKCALIVIAFGFIVNILSGMAADRLGLEKLVEAGRLTARAELQIANLIDRAFTFLIFSVAMIAVVKCAERIVTQREASGAEALAEGLRRWPRYLWTGFLGGLIIMGLCCLFIIPGLVWMIYYMFLPYVVSVTSLSGKKALDYSKSLVQGAFWRTIGYFFVIGFAAAIPALILALCGQTAVNLLTPHLPKAAQLAASALALAIAQLPVIFQLSLGTVFFLNTAYLKR
jgi:hypothetical protein